MLKLKPKTVSVLICVVVFFDSQFLWAQVSPSPSTNVPAPVVSATADKQITFQTLSTYEFHRKLRWLFGGNYVVNFGDQVTVAALRTPSGSANLQVRFHTAGTVDIVGQSTPALQLARLLSILDLSSSTGNVRALVARRRGTLDRDEIGQTQSSSDTSSRERRNLIQPVQFEQPSESQNPPLDPRIRQRLRDLGENVQVEVLPELDVIVLRGRDQDIDELARIIEELERAAEDAQSRIEIVPLQHARDEAVAELVEQVSEQYTGARQGRVTVTPLSKPNAALVVGWGQAFDATIELIRKLDQAVPTATQMEVIPLSNASASATAQTIEEFYANRENLGAKVTVTFDARTNAVVIHAAPRDLAEVRRLVKQLDASRGQATHQLRVFELANALAVDVASLLETALSNEGDANERNAALEILMVDATGRQRILSANLDNLQITPNPNNNTIIVSASAELLAIIEQLIVDVDSARTPSQIKLFRITHGDASTLVNVLRSLLISDTAGASRLPNAAAESSLAPLRFAVEERTNSIIASGPSGDLRIVESLLTKLDEGETNARSNAVYHLKNTPAVDVANTINQFLADKRQIDATGATGLSTQLRLDKEVVVVPEPINNKLILSATPRYFDELHELIQRLDEPPPQVVIQVLIGEVVHRLAVPQSP